MFLKKLFNKIGGVFSNLKNRRRLSLPSDNRTRVLVLFVLAFSSVGIYQLTFGRATTPYGDVPTEPDEIVIRYERPGHSVPPIPGEFPVDPSPAMLLYANGLMLCSTEPDSTGNIITTYRQLSKAEVKSVFDKVRSLGFDNHTNRNLSPAQAQPVGASASVALNTTIGYRETSISRTDSPTRLAPVTQYLDSECAIATQNYDPDDILVYALKTNKNAKRNLKDLPSKEIPDDAEVGRTKSKRIKGTEASNVKKSISKGGKTPGEGAFKGSDNKEIKVRYKINSPDYKVPGLAPPSIASAQSVSAAADLKVRFLFVYAADQSLPSYASNYINDFASTVPGYYNGQVGKNFNSTGVTIVKGSKTVAQYTTCPQNAANNCQVETPGFPGKSTVKWFASHYNLSEEFTLDGYNTHVMYDWDIDWYCAGLGTNSVSAFGTPTYGIASHTIHSDGYSNVCGNGVTRGIGAHELGHGFTLSHTTDDTLMGTADAHRGYSIPLNSSQANYLNNSSPYFNSFLPVINLSASPTNITSGQSSTITWSSSKATSCTAYQAWGGGRSLSGSQTVSPTSTKTYQLTCKNAYGDATKTVTINVNAPTGSAPTLNFSASPTTVITGQASTLSWSSSGASSCTASGAWSGGKTSNGSQSVTPSTSSTYSLTCSNSYGNTSKSVSVKVTPSDYIALNPARLLDTRSGGTTIDSKYQRLGMRANGSITRVRVLGRGGVPSDAKTVSLNVTITNQTANGYLTVFPCGISIPGASTLNYQSGVIIANAVISKVGTNGEVCIYNYSSANLILDVNGAFKTTTHFTGLTPARLLDTRPTGTTVDGTYRRQGLRSAGSVTRVKVRSRAGVPSNAPAVSLNVVVTNQTSSGFLTVFPCGISVPKASTLNYQSGVIIANAVISKVGTNGEVCIYNSSSANLILDVNGAFKTTTHFAPLNPARLLDTRTNGSTIDGKYQRLGLRSNGNVTRVRVVGRGGVLTTAKSVSLNVTVVNQPAYGYITVYPCGISVPSASTLNYRPYVTIANAVISKVGTNGEVCIYNYTSANLILDVNGAFKY